MIKFLKALTHYERALLGVLLGGIALLPFIGAVGILVIIAAMLGILDALDDRVEFNSMQWNPNWLGLFGGIALLPFIRWLGILVIIAAMLGILGALEERVKLNS